MPHGPDNNVTVSEFVLFFATLSDSFSILFRVTNHQIEGKENLKLNLLFKLSYLSSNFALTLGYLNPVSNNPVLVVIYILYI